MKIEINRKANFCYFNELKIGDTFFYENHLYIKGVTSVTLTNAFNFSTNEMQQFTNKVEVYPYKCKIVTDYE